MDASSAYSQITSILFGLTTGVDKAIPCLAAARIQRWALLLSGYNDDLRYPRRELNANADCVSRLPQPFQESSNSEKNGLTVGIFLKMTITSIIEDSIGGGNELTKGYTL